MITKSDYLNYLETLLERMRRDSSVIDLAYTEDELPLPDGRHRRLTVHWVETDTIQDENIQFEVIEEMVDACIEKYGLVTEWPDNLTSKLKAILEYIKILEEVRP